jgi:hypothetical protein
MLIFIGNDEMKQQEHKFINNIIIGVPENFVLTSLKPPSCHVVLLGLAGFNAVWRFPTYTPDCGEKTWPPFI